MRRAPRNSVGTDDAEQNAHAKSASRAEASPREPHSTGCGLRVGQQGHENGARDDQGTLGPNRMQAD